MVVGLRRIISMNKRFFPFLLLLLIASACKPSFTPSDIRPNDRCARCKQPIAEKNMASEILFAGGDTMKFNDLGCLVVFHFGIDTTTECAVFVQDYHNGGWLNEDEAYVLLHSNIHTPMNSGTVAFSSRSGAQKAKETAGGEVQSLAEILRKESIWLPQ